MTTHIHGTVAPGFERVRDAFAANWQLQNEVGASACVTVGGETDVDLWGGSATYDHGEGQWEKDTIVNVFSTTKTMSFLCCLLLADRGQLDLHAPVADYWPEFAANGKDQIATRHIMGHTAGLPGWDEPLSLDDIPDHDRLVSLLAAQAPWWEPGTASGYHASTQGFLLGEIVKRVDGRSLGRFFADEIAGPLDADFHIGTGPEHDHRVAHVIPPPGTFGDDPTGILPPLEEGSIPWKVTKNPVFDGSIANTVEFRRAEHPAGGGHGNARSIAEIHALTANGGVAKGKQIISPEGLEPIFDVQSDGIDKVIPVHIKFGMGFGLPSRVMPLPNERTCFWAGWGGSLVIIDMDLNMTVSYAMNRMAGALTGDLRGVGIVVATYAAMAARA